MEMALISDIATDKQFYILPGATQISTDKQFYTNHMARFYTKLHTWLLKYFRSDYNMLAT